LSSSHPWRKKIHAYFGGGVRSMLFDPMLGYFPNTQAVKTMGLKKPFGRGGGLGGGGGIWDYKKTPPAGKNRKS